MQIAGGFYREQCCRPAWDAMFGSGGRAAITVCTLSPASSLHAYAENCDIDALVELKKQGIELQISHRPSGVVFSYFHPLSRPHIYPTPHDIARQPSITVKGDAVLRFGFLEGEAVVDADYAVYDPQTWRNPVPFSANGSRANALAIVLNALELQSFTGHVDSSQAAQKIINEQNADVVVVKRGIWGATVYERSGLITSIPVYRSSRVFKIGTGDVFSAIFSHFWAEKKLSANKAADLASRFVAAYCNSGQLPITISDTHVLEPVKCRESGTVFLVGAVNSIGQRYTMEEARFVLKELGLNVSCPALNDTQNGSPDSILILAEGADTKIIQLIEQEWLNDIPIVVLQEKGVRCNKLLSIKPLITASIANDFTTAMYFAAWAASEAND